jgi:hypothetical protein
LPLNPVFNGPSMSERVDGNAAIEIHDSTLQRVDVEGKRLCAILSAYVHRSAGTPGTSNGAGWSQTAHIHLEGGTASTQVESPIWLMGGRIDLGGRIHDNVLPLPLAFDGPVRVELEGSKRRTGRAFGA